MKTIKVEIEILPNSEGQHELFSSVVSTMILLLRHTQQYCVNSQMAEYVDGLAMPQKPK